MKTKSLILVVCFLTTFFQGLQAAEKQDQAEILAKRGEGIVYQSTFEARASKIPKEYRQNTLGSTKQLQDLINTLLINAQLAADAREAGFDREHIVIERMQLAAESELAAAWLQHYMETQPAADYEMLALEYYQLNQDNMYSSPKIDVSHILISTKDHNLEEAKELADSLSDQLTDQPSLFDQFVTEYSEDPGAATNKGMYKSVTKGRMEKPFEEVAFALKENEISPPVRTIHGYHIIRLDAHIAATRKTFDEVKQPLIERERKQHEDRIKQDYLGRLTSLNVEMTKEALDELFKRQLGEDYSESGDSVPETE